MTKENLVIKSAGQKLVVQGDRTLLSKLSKHPFTTNYIPEYGFAWSSAKNQNTYDLVIREGRYTSFVQSENTSRLTLGQVNLVSIEDIITVIDYCLDRKRQSEGIYVVHGSACSQNGKGIVFFGPISGIGKTSINVDMCQRYKFEFIGDEKILVNSTGYVIGGTKSLYFNKPELFKWLDKDLHNKDMKTSGKLSIASEPAKCKIFIQPIITSASDGLGVVKWDENKANWHLYEELTRKIRGSSRRIADYTIGLQSIDSDELTQKRISAVKLISESARFYLIMGSKDSISKYIYESIQKD